MGEANGLSLFTLDEIVLATGGRIDRKPVKEPRITKVVIDSRKAVKDSLFVPLAGNNTDGHLFLKSAVTSGASVVFVSGKKRDAVNPSVMKAVEKEDAAVISVSDPLVALQRCALFHVNRHRGAVRIGITGSSGKTTTKEILGSILSKSAPTMMNEGNLNSEIGLPLSAFALDGAHEFALFEMGMNHEGEMDVLAEIVDPDYALITNIGTAHIGLLGTRKRIALEKKKIFKHFTGNQKGFLFEDEEFYSFLAEGVSGTIMPYGVKTTKGIKGYKDLGLDGIAIDWEGLRVLYPLFGFHNLVNALGAMSVAMEIGIDRNVIKDGIESVSPLFGRSQIERGRITVIKDCYNANPDSLAHVLSFFGSLEWKGRKIAVLGSMLELGKESESAHAEAVRRAMLLDTDAVFFFGAEYEKAFYNATVTKPASGGQFLKWTNEMDTLLVSVREFVKEGDIVLLKASRGMALERVAEALSG